MPSAGRKSTLASVALVACVAAACGEDTPAEPLVLPARPEATTISLSPASATLHALGDTVRFTPTVFDQHGNPMPDVQVVYHADPNTVAMVDGSGLATATGHGTAVVRAALGKASTTSTVAVRQQVADVRVAPDQLTFFAVGDTARLVAEAADANGHEVADAEFTWTSDSPAVTVEGGLVTASTSGTAVVTATSGGASGSATVTVTVLSGAAKDRAILEVFYDATGGPSWSDNRNWLTDAPLDRWRGVLANAEGRVVALNLPANNLVGHIPAELGGLEKLRHLRLHASWRLVLACAYPNYPPRSGSQVPSHPSRSGSEVSSRPFRSGWEVSNRLSRSGSETWISEAADGQTRVVRVSPDSDSLALLDSPANAHEVPNRLTGRIPPALGDLANLETLYLLGNELEGTLPPALGKLSNLKEMWLSGNRLTGPLPPEWGELASLESLLLGTTHDYSLTPPQPRYALSGPLPPELGNLVNLRVLSLFANRFTGPLPPEIGALGRLQALKLTCNRLSGPIPPELGQLSNLEQLGLSANLFAGELPASLGQLAQLVSASFSSNFYLTGAIPPQLGELTRLQQLSLAKNQFSGRIPTALGRMTGLAYLTLSDNDLTGAIPSQLGNLAALRSLSLANNRLTGPIPQALGKLAQLDVLWLGGNNLTGRIPPQLGDMTLLRSLVVSHNNLAGPIPAKLASLGNLGALWVHANPALAGAIPHELTRSSLRTFKWYETRLCGPRDRAFQDWLASIGSEGPRCSLVPRRIFEAFYEATGGEGWTKRDGWLSAAAVASWFGVTVENNLVTALDLSGNGLAGPLPATIGDFPDLKRLDLADNALAGEIPEDIGVLTDLDTLDLSGNQFSGGVPRELTNLRALWRLDLSDNQMEGGLPGDLTRLHLLSDFDWTDSGACAPEAAWFQTWLGSVANSSGPVCDGPISLSIATAHLTQAAQNQEASVPLIAGRPALLRVLATADRANDHRPIARARVTVDGREVHAADIPLTSSRGLAEHPPGWPSQWHQALVPAEALRPGAELALQVDPDSVVPRTPLDDVVLPLEVRELPPMELTIVPVVTASGQGAAVVDWVRGAEDPPVELMRALLPVGQLELAVREPLVVAALPRAGSWDDWSALLQDIELLRTAEGGRGYWYGVVNRDGDRGVRGMAQIAGWTSLGLPDEEVFAHELGHNMGLRHAPCGGPQGVDPQYPYDDGSIGVTGFDPRSRQLVLPTRSDVMSYCSPVWISDFSFAKALEYRMQTEARQMTSAAAATRASAASTRIARTGLAAQSAQPAPRPLPAQPAARATRLLLWGQVSPTGELRLDPAFELHAPTKLPAGAGPYRIEGFLGDGARAFAFDFDMHSLSDGGGTFQFLVPVRPEELASLERVSLAGPSGEAELARGMHGRPMALVVDAATARIRSILRGEGAEAAAAEAGAGMGGADVAGEQVLVSHGLPEGPKG